MDERSLNLYLETNQITKIVRAKVSSTIHFASTTPLILVSFLYARTVANKRSRSQSCKKERDEKTRKVFRSNRATNRHVRFNKFSVDISLNCECILFTDLVAFLVRILTLIARARY